MAEPDLADHETRIAELERLVKSFLGDQLQSLRSDTQAALDRAKDVVAAQAVVVNAKGRIDAHDTMLQSMQADVDKLKSAAVGH